MVELVPSLLRQELDRLAADGQRIDGRGQFDGREVHLEVDCLYMLKVQQRSFGAIPSSMLVSSSKFEHHGQTDQHKVH